MKISTNVTLWIFANTTVRASILQGHTSATVLELDMKVTDIYILRFECYMLHVEFSLVSTICC